MKLIKEKFTERVNEIKNKCGYYYQLTAYELDVLRYNYEHTRSIVDWERLATQYIKRLKEEH